MQQMDPENFAYNITRATRLEGNLNKQALEKSINEIVHRHEILRTRFVFDNEKPAQIILSQLSIPLEIVDLTDIPAEKQEGRVQQAILDESRRPFDLSRGPALRTRLLALSDEVIVFLLVIHHIIADGTSIQIFTRELVQLYDAFSGAKPTPLSELAIQYVDYTCWQRQWFGQDGLEFGLRKKQESYWLDQFKDEIPVLSLPTDYKRPVIQSFEGNQLTFELEANEIRSINRIVLSEGSTLFIVLLAIYNIFLSKLSGMADIVVGSPMSGRRHTTVQPLIGMFVNTLALRNYPHHHQTFRNFLGEVKTRTLSAFENQEYRYEDLVERLNINRDTGRNPLFDVAFLLLFDDREAIDVNISSLQFRSYEWYNYTSKFDLILNAWKLGETLKFTFEYCTGLFKESTIQRYSVYFRTILNSIVKDPHKKIADIEILPSEERRRLLHDFNDTQASFPQDQTIHRLFDQQVSRSPDHVALVGTAAGAGKGGSTGGDHQLTYRQLNRQARAVAAMLAEKGVVPGRIVGIMVGPAIELVIGIMGILKSASAYLPIDPGYPRERASYMLADSAAEILLTDAKIRESVEAEVESMNVSDQCLEATAPAYVIYTSGTTGKPKGVMVEHRSLVNLCCWHNRCYGVEPADHAAKYAAVGFDASVWEIFPYLIKGASLYIVPDSIKLDMDRLNDYFEQRDITIAFLPTQVCEQFLGQQNLSLRRLLTGGDKLNQFATRRYRLYNNYGPTENTVVATSCLVQGKADNIPIGKPIDNVKIYILDRDHFQIQPIGIAGELCVAGLGLSRGYINRPEETAERFSPQVIEGAAPCRVYHTGDLARWLTDGNIEFLGRIDHQVKIRGFRIELGEIENQLLKHEEFRDALVVVKDNHVRYLCAYLVAREKIDIPALKEQLSRHLPGYMIPAFFMQIDRIPLTANGKVDRKALPEPELGAAEEAVVPPQNVNEERLVEVWQEVLGLDTIGITDHFFEMGGDSIKAIQVSARLKKYGLILSITDLFMYPTIKELGKHIRAQERTIDQGMVEGEVELTPIQCWFFQSRFTHKHHFNQAVILYRQEGFDEEILKAVLKKLVEHHDALRMVYKLSEDGVIQINRGEIEPMFDFEVFDYREREDVEANIDSEASRIQGGIDLQAGPLVKVGLFKTADGDHLLIVIHHLVIDGISWRILLEDFVSGYRQVSQSEEIELPAKTDSFRDWARALKEYAAGDRGESENAVLLELAYWQSLDSQKLDPLPVDFEIGCPGKKNKDNEAVVVNLGPEQTELLLRQVNWAYNTDINDILLTALGLALKGWRGIDKVGINLEGHGRESILEGLDISRTVGWFTSQYPVILDMQGSEDLPYTIKSVKETLRQIPRKGVGYGILKYLTPIENIRGHRFVLEPEVSFNYLGQFAGDIGLGERTGFTLSPNSSGYDVSPESESRYKLDINGALLDKRLRLSVTYNKLEYSKEGIERLAACFESSLLKIIEHCCRKEEKELTPSDLGYSDISLQDLEEFEDDLSDIY